jgi:hypothetical protein
MVKWLQNPGPGQPPQPAPGGQPVPVPQVIKEMGDFIEAAMPTITKITGLTNREITFALLKGTLKGGSLDAILNSLMGRPAVQEAKFARQVKTLAIWVPVFCGLMGGIIIFFYFLLLVMKHMLGALPV